MNYSSNLVLGAMVLGILCFQMSNGTMVFLYISEVVVDAATGICLLMLLAWMVLQSLTCETLFDIDGYGVKGVFLSVGIFQAVIIAFIYCFVRETKGLNKGQKKNLYKPKKKGLKKEVSERD